MHDGAAPLTLPDGLRIRAAALSDAAALAQIYNETVLAGGITFQLSPVEPSHFEAQLAGLGPREAAIVLEESRPAELDGAAEPPAAILGYGVLFLYSDREGYRLTAETSVYLRHGVKRRGYGSLLKRALIERAREFGFHHLVAKVVAGNAASIEYNRRFGYEMVGVQREAGFVDGQWLDVAIMQLILD